MTPHPAPILPHNYQGPVSHPCTSVTIHSLEHFLPEETNLEARWGDLEGRRQWGSPYLTHRPREQVARRCGLEGWPALCAQASTGYCRRGVRPKEHVAGTSTNPVGHERLALEAIRAPLPLVALWPTFAIRLLYPPSPTTAPSNF